MPKPTRPLTGPSTHTTLHARRAPCKRADTPREPPILTAQEHRERLRTIKEIRSDRTKRATTPQRMAPSNRSVYTEIETLRTRELRHAVRPGIWAGHRAFIIGGGASLRRFDWRCLSSELVVGINRAFEVGDWAFNVAMDTNLFARFECGDAGEAATARWKNYAGYRVWWGGSNYLFPPPDRDHPYDIWTVEPAAHHEFPLGSLARLSAANNTGVLALNLAVVLGASPIYLLGFDMNSPTTGQSWWHDGYAGKDQGAKVYASFIRDFELIAPRIPATTEVINLNPDSALPTFPKKPARSVLAVPRPLRPVITSFYTPDTGYEGEARRLRRSCALFGLECDIRAMPSRGNWLANASRKPHHLLEVMAAHPGRTVVWMDADNVVQRYPELLDGAPNWDVAFVTVDWSALPVGRNDKELLSATVALAPTPAARALVTAWAKAVDENPTWNDQRALREALGKTRAARVCELPLTYCQIFDTMAGVGEPVIETFQASRRLRSEVRA